MGEGLRKVMMNIAEIMKCGVYSLGAFLTLEVCGADRSLEEETANPSLRLAAVQPVNQATEVVARNNNDSMEQATHRLGYNFQLLNEVAALEQISSSFVAESPWDVAFYAAPAGGSGGGDDPAERLLRELRVRENSTHPQPWSSNLIGMAHRLNEMINPVLELQDQLARLARIQQWAVDAWADNSRMGLTEVNSTEDDLPPDEEKNRFPGMSIGINHPRPAYSRRLDNLADLRDSFSTNLSGPSLHRSDIESFFVHFDEEESPEVIRCSTDLVVLPVSAGGHRVAYLTDFTLPSNLNFVIATGNEGFFLNSTR